MERVRRRAGAIWLLLSNCPVLARYRGGYKRLALHLYRLMRSRGLGSAVLWSVSSIAYLRRDDARMYRAWLARTPAVPVPRHNCHVLIVLGLTNQDRVDAERILAYTGSLLDETTSLRIAISADLEDPIAESIRRYPSGEKIGTTGCTHDQVIAEGLAQGLGVADVAIILGPGACLAEGAVRTVRAAVANGADFAYGDEDVLTPSGQREKPYFKPDFSPDLLLVHDYVSGCFAVSRELFERCEVRRGRPAFNFIGEARSVVHIPRVLHHGTRAHGRETVCSESFRSYARAQFGNGVSVEGIDDGAPRVDFGTVKDQARVSVVIPTKDRLELLVPCVESLYECNDDISLDVLVIDNGSREEQTRDWLFGAPDVFPGLRWICADEPFNWSRLNNLGIERTEGDVCVFLNNDTRSITRNWLRRVAEYALRPDVGVVGTMLRYPDDSLQHAGVVVGYGGCADHIYLGVPADHSQPMFVPPSLPRNVMAVTGACMAISRTTLEAIGNFDEALRVVGGDVELCIRAWRRGLVNVYLGDVELYHLESQSRPRRDPTADIDRLRRIVEEWVPQDPYFNVNLTFNSRYPSYPLWRERQTARARQWDERERNR
ncbi:MAG: glycosyltransferase [Gammaproteobacteria bacterium]|nr:glycosyltransferase [Gammaproteobacteria bacterium]